MTTNYPTSLDNYTNPTVTGGSLTCSTNGYLVYSQGDGVSVTGVRGVNPSANPSYYSASGSDFQVSNCTGDRTVGYASGVPSLLGRTVASAAITGATGVKTAGVGCTTARSGTGTYVITYDSALSAAQVVIDVSIRRSGQSSVTWEISAQSTSAITIETYNAAGSLFDPTELFVTITN